MVGIYKITNLLNGKSYIGQSHNIEKRMKSHTYKNDSNISREINKYGKENFSFDVLQECDESELDDLEEKYILEFNSIEPNGYNIRHGGQHNKGLSNPNCKLTPEEVYDIREAYNNHEFCRQVYEKYKDKVTFNYFQNLWEGRSWKNIHMDVYTPENKKFFVDRYVLNKWVCEDGAPSMIFTVDEVHEIRERYVNETAREIYEDYKDRCSFQTIQQILWGRHFQNVIPIYDKKKKNWVF